MFGLFSKKENNVAFEATKRFSNFLQYDEARGLIKVMNKKDLIPIDSIQLYNLKFDNKTYNKVNLGKALVGGSLFGVAGILLAGTHTEEYISNLTIEIKANDKFYYIPMIIGKMKMSSAKGILNCAEEMITFLNEVTAA